MNMIRQDFFVVKEQASAYIRAVCIEMYVRRISKLRFMKITYIYIYELFEVGMDIKKMHKNQIPACKFLSPYMNLQSFDWGYSTSFRLLNSDCILQ